MGLNPSPISRRQFLDRTACAAVGATGLLSAIGTLRLFNATLAAQTVPADGHKALVCLFLFGGNDANNTLVPYDQPSYDAYLAARTEIALPRETLLPLPLAGTEGGDYALHPSLRLLRGVIQQGQGAVVGNVGTLVAPVTRGEILRGGAALPPYLFSHNDQQVQWQTSVPDSPRRIGWGGRVADLLHVLNGAGELSMNISLAGSNYFQAGEQTVQYSVGPNGSEGLTGYLSTATPRRQQYIGLNQALGQSYSNLFEAEYSSILDRAITKDVYLTEILSTTPRFDQAASAGRPDDRDLFPNARTPEGALTDVGKQLHMILRLIHAQARLGQRRQIFFASIGGWDMHQNQLAQHARLLKFLDDGLHDFYRATVTLGISDRVTSFTSSDFNRTYSTNAKGSDHAWGAHHFVVGGAVKGGRLYGRIPVLQSGGPDDATTRGRWIPNISTDEYAATLAKWFGVSAANMPLALPNIRRFPKPDLGFMK
jgi:uncharacterized protein (DUF1501 family)